MRDVFGIGSGGSSRKLDRPEVQIEMSSVPGYLELTPQKMKLLVCHEPIEKFYEVEDQPFARGKYAAVRRCRHRLSGQQFAAKFLRKRRRSADLRPEILHEVAVLDACASSIRIVRLHQVFESAHEMILLLELASGGELQMLLDKDEVPEERQVKRLMHQILDGLVFLHSINVAHLDIKPQNLVLMSEFPHGEVKLCDLGISRYISQGADIRDILGTPDYVAPEVLNYEPISLSTDMWSVGVLLYVLLTGCSPFGGDTKQETFCNISQCKLDFPKDLFEDVSEDAKDLMRKLMVKDPSKRLSATECLQHCWFTNVDPVPVQPMQTPVSFSETVTSRGEEALPKLSPAIPRKQNITNKTVSHQETTVMSKTSPAAVTASLSGIRCRESSVPVAKSTEMSSVVSTVEKSSERMGMTISRRNRFMKNMENLAQSYVDLANTENNNIIDNKTVLEKTDIILSSTYGLDKSSNVKESVNVSSKVENNNSTCISVRSVNKATAMQTMPVSAVTSYKFNRASSNIETSAKQRQQNLNIASETESEIPRRVMDNDDCVYTCRRCIIIDDSEDETLISSGAASLLIPSPVMTVTSENTHSYSDHSSSDSGSDTVSEMSIDSSSDRSSIISLDDSLLEYNCPKVNVRSYPGGTYVSYSSPNHNVWDSTGTLNTPRNERISKYSHSETFSRALARFSSISGDTQEPGIKEPQDRSSCLASPRKHIARAAHTSVLNKVMVSSVSTNNTSAIQKVDFMRERNGNIVVIREVRSGKYNRVSEVKCESVQSRIRKLQVQGTKS